MSDTQTFEDRIKDLVKQTLAELGLMTATVPAPVEATPVSVPPSVWVPVPDPAITAALSQHEAPAVETAPVAETPMPQVQLDQTSVINPPEAPSVGV